MEENEKRQATKATITRRSFDAKLPPAPVYSETRDELVAFCRERGMAVSTVVRIAVEAYLRAHRRAKRGRR